MSSYMDLTESVKISRAINRLEEAEANIIEARNAADYALQEIKSCFEDLEDALNEIRTQYERKTDPNYRY